MSGNSARYFGGGHLQLRRHRHTDELHCQWQLCQLLWRRTAQYLGTASLTNCTISGNSTGYSGGGIYNYGGPVTLTNSIVAGNSSAHGGADIGGYSSVSGSYNLIGIGGSGGLTDGLTATWSAWPTRGWPLWETTADRPRPCALLPDSPAIDAGTSGPGISATDQRGLGRVGPTDIGADESQGYTLTVVADSTPQTATIGTEFANPLAVVVTANNPLEPVDGGVVNFTAIPAGTGASAFLSGSRSSSPVARPPSRRRPTTSTAVTPFTRFCPAYQLSSI